MQKIYACDFVLSNYTYFKKIKKDIDAYLAKNPDVKKIAIFKKDYRCLLDFYITINEAERSNHKEQNITLTYKDKIIVCNH